ncbi:MAG: hypothetical protein EOP11_15950 [Proteobacteria bacterium]|nr:MAG: hypothetical protein EOP11_15950 [Pseudomonadota bacterium]
MKLSLLALSLLALSPLTSSAQAALTCTVSVPSEPRNFSIDLIDIKPEPGTSRYVLVNKELTAAEEISKENYLARKAEKFAGIDGQAVVIFLQDSDLSMGITYGFADAQAGKLVNGVSAFSDVTERTLVLFPLNQEFAVGCRIKK